MAGSATIAGKQFYTLGIGHPNVPFDRESDPALGQVAAAVRESIAAASVSNPATAAPYAAAPSWVASTTYVQGAVVRGIGAGNTDNLFLQVQTPSGVSAAATGPVGAVTAGITTDNTCRWLYIGKTSATGTYPLFSTVTPTASTDVMDGYLAVVPTSAYAALGLTRQFNSQVTDSIARVTGGVIYSNNAISVRGPNDGTVAAPSFPSSAERWSVHIQTDCRKWLAIQPVSSVGTRAFYIEVNGRRLSEGQIVNSPAAASSARLLDLSTFPAGTKDVRIYSINEIRGLFFRLYVGADENIWTPSPKSNLMMAFEGDSITQAAGTGSQLYTDFVDALITKQLGIERFYNNAVGGTGAISDNGGAKTTYIQRLPGIIENNPDILLIGGFHNDADKGESASVRRAAVLTYLRAVRAALPSCTVFVVGVQMLAGDSLVTGANSMFDMETEAKAAFDEWGDSNSAFIRTITNPYKFPGSTSSNSWFYQSSGSAPFADSHPTPRYYRAYADFVVQAIKQFYGAVSA